ncbi:ABC transporter substrate-binding protein [Xinfangfangia pollutisoli]|uniref:ABC transporter substrate-binding protein n=1 Tax=Xinfangfangia pollutisoli TaxID=2865960 RepID=UPI001CD7473D|nr:ABC transporter substrate-binding protein [Xinfangfangia pollutisoli]
MKLTSLILAAGLAAATGAAAFAETATEGGKLVIRLNADIRATDGVNRDGNTDMVLHHIFETLVAYRDDLTIGPLLAESWTVSEDGRVYTFTLREGAKFHNGAPVTAQDVVWNWERKVSQGADWFCNAYFDGSQGMKVESVAAADDRTVVFTIDAPNALFLAQLANIQCNAWVAHPDSVAADGSWKAEAPIGSGPFQMAEWKRGQYVELQKFQDYVPVKAPMSGYAGDRSAHVDAVRFLVIPDTAAAEAALYAGQIDVLPDLEPANIPEAEKNGAQVVTGQGLGFQTVLVQTADPLLSDVRMRKAIIQAIDFKQIAELRSGGLTGFNPSMVAQASSFFDEDFLEWPAYDPAASAALLAEIGYKGEPITIQTNTRYQSMYEVGVLVQAMLQASGINAQLEVLDWATQLDNYSSGKFQLQSFSYSPRLDPSLLYGLFLGDKAERASTQWESPEAMQLYIESTQTSDPEARKALFKKLHALLVQDLAVMGVMYVPQVDAVGSAVSGYDVWPGGRARGWGVSKTK